MIAPAFGLIETKGFLPHVMDAVTKVRELSIPSQASGLTQIPARWRTSGTPSLRAARPDIQPLLT